MSTAFVVGNVIGVGIFVLPASLAPLGLNALTGWLITVVGCSLLAIALSNLARAFPNDDGPYSYVKRAFGDATAFIVMWCYWFSTWVTSATIAIGIVGYLTVLVPALSATAWVPPVTALSLLWFFVLINLVGARAVGWVQIMTTVLKLVPLVGVICLGLWVLFTNPHAYTQHVPHVPATFKALSGATTLTLFAMLGIECAMVPAGRVRDPSRTIPRATLIGTIVTATIYIGVSVVPMLLIPQAALAASQGGLLDGKRITGVPDAQANLGLEWHVPMLRSLTLDGHVVYTGSQSANGANTTSIPASTRLDLGGRYGFSFADTQITVRGSVENVTGKDYWASVGGEPGVNYLVLAAPRAIKLSLSVDL